MRHQHQRGAVFARLRDQHVHHAWRRWPGRGCRSARRPAAARAVHQRAGDRHALQLAAAELLRQARAQAREADGVEHAAATRAVVGPRPAASAAAPTFCATSRCGSTWKAWNTKPTCWRRQSARASASSVPMSTPSMHDRAGVPAVEPGHAVEQRRFADARLADDRDELAGRDVERHVLEHRQPRRSACPGRVMRSVMRWLDDLRARTCCDGVGRIGRRSRGAAACCAARSAGAWRAGAWRRCRARATAVDAAMRRPAHSQAWR